MVHCTFQTRWVVYAENVQAVEIGDNSNSHQTAMCMIWDSSEGLLTGQALCLGPRIRLSAKYKLIWQVVSFTDIIALYTCSVD